MYDTFDRITVAHLMAEVQTAKEITFYVRHPLPGFLFKKLRGPHFPGAHPTVKVVVEGLGDVEHLRKLYDAGFSVLYGLALPPQQLIFLGHDRGFVLEPDPKSRNQWLTPLKEPENIYFKLLWRTFGNAVLLSGSVREIDSEKKLFCLETRNGKEQWCRFKGSTGGDPSVGAEIKVFAWEKWGSQILELLAIEASRNERLEG